MLTLPSLFVALKLLTLTLSPHPFPDLTAQLLQLRAECKTVIQMMVQEETLEQHTKRMRLSAISNGCGARDP